MVRQMLTVVLLFGLVSVTLGAEKAGDSGKVRKYVRFQKGDTIAYGLVEGEQVRELQGPFANWQPTERTHPLSEVTILVPTEPTKVIALAGNYKDHLGDRPAPEQPEPFFKVPSSLQRHEGEVIQPQDASPVHYEAEVVIVISKRAKNVKPEEALDYVLGITCGNDISEREWQDGDVQWWRAKGSDTFGPVGPFVASGLDYGHLEMTLRVNGEVRQQTNTRNMIHGIPETISFISRYVTLEPGDLIFTGTPGQTQGMSPGDIVEVEIEGVGVLRNQLVSEQQ